MAKGLISKKEEGNKAFRAGKHAEAYKLYTEALEIDPNNVYVNSKLYNNRATVSCKVRLYLFLLKKYELCILILHTHVVLLHD